MEASGYADRPDYRVDLLRRRNHVTARFGDAVVAESEECLIVDEQDHGLVVYFPRGDVQTELLPSEHHTRCPFKGTASYWSLPGDDGLDVAWSYETPYPEVAPLRGYVAFYQDRVRVEVGVAPRVRPDTARS